jgi:hypothetical protein
MLSINTNYIRTQFIGADPDKRVDCVPGCYGPDRPKRYNTITVKEYVDMRITANY